MINIFRSKIILSYVNIEGVTLLHAFDCCYFLSYIGKHWLQTAVAKVLSGLPLPSGRWRSNKIE